jgi:hypothetical protein
MTMPPDADLIVTMADLRALEHCSRGGRAFAARHGFDWLVFVRDGIPAARLLEIDDAMAHAVVAYARERVAREHAQTEAQA